MVHDVADSNSTVPQYRYRMILGIEICNADCTSGNWRLVDRSQQSFFTNRPVAGSTHTYMHVHVCTFLM